MTDSEIINLSIALKAPGMSDAALRAVSTPAASLAAWLWAVLRYRLAQHRGLPTGLLLRQVEATLAREQAQLAHYQFQSKEILEHNLALTTQLEGIQASHGHLVESLSWSQSDQYHTWPIKAALLAPMHSWTAELQVTNPSQISPPKFISAPLPAFLLLPVPSLPPSTPLCPFAMLSFIPCLAPSLLDPLPLPSSLACTPSGLPFHTRS